MVLIKGVEQDPDLGVNFFHSSIDDDSEATDSDKQENIDQNAPKTPYDDENINNSSDDEVNNDEVDPDPTINDANINANYDDKKMIMRLPLIHLQMVKITKQLTMTNFFYEEEAEKETDN